MHRERDHLRFLMQACEEKAMDDKIILDGNLFDGYEIPSGNTFILVIKG